jgi:TP901-1 family phage major tail protein
MMPPAHRASVFCCGAATVVVAANIIINTAISSPGESSNKETIFMPAEKGSAFLLKVGDGAVAPVYSTVAGLRTTQLSVNGDAVVITNKGSGAWRELLSGAGVRSVSVSGAGVFTGSVAEMRIKNNALSGLLDDYELSFESGDRLQGKFLVARLDYAGDFNGERSYTLALESSGPVASL